MFLWSPFDGMGVYAPKVWSKGLFWLGLSLLGLTITTNYYKRGQRSRFGQRWSMQRGLLCLGLVGFVVATGRHAHQSSQEWIQTQVRPIEAAERAQYEKLFGKYRDLIPPEVGEFRLDLDLFPAQRRFEYRLDAELTSKQEVSELFVQSPLHAQLDLKIQGQSIAPIAERSEQRLGVRIFEIPRALPGLSFQAQHRFAGHPKKKERPLGVVDNGSYLDQNAIATLHYDSEVELDTPIERELHGLGDRALGSPQQQPIRRDCPWRGGPRSWTIELSTSADQYAVAPGKLLKSWRSPGRRHFQYSAEQADCSELAFTSARFKELTGSDAPVQVRVLYLPGYETAASEIETLVGRALSKLQSVLGDYPYTTLQVVQVRDDSPLGIAPANTLFLRQSEAWDLRVQSPRDEHLRIYYIVLRLAQHWMHNRVAPADLPGKGLFNEGVPVFLAYAWLEELFGKAWLQKKYLTRAMRRYFWYHGAHSSTEASVIESPGVEHIDTCKAAFALRAYARAIGQAQIYEGLAELVASSKKGEAAWTARDFKARLDQAMEGQVIDSPASEMLAEVVHYDNRLRSATWSPLPSQKFRLTLELFTQRWQTSKAHPTPTLAPWPRPLEIEVELVGSSGKKRVRRLINVGNGANHVELEFDHRPVQVTIDPEMELLDQSLKDQRSVVERGSEN